MNHREVLELKRRFTKDKCTINRVCGCYIDATKRKVAKINHTFLSLEDEEFFKYLDIAKKCLSGKIDNNLINLQFSTDSELNGPEHKSLMALRDSKLMDDAILDAFYDHIIENYSYDENYLILLFYDSYDIPMKTKDNMALDDSDEVYEYIMCAICPVDLSKPGLSYKEESEDIASRKRDWVVGAVNSGFLFPAFNDRSSDIHSVLCYTKDAKAPHTELWENGLGVEAKLTSSQKRSLFEGLVAGEFESDDQSDDILMEIQQGINNIIVERELAGEECDILLTKETLEDILRESGAEESNVSIFSQKYEGTFENEDVKLQELIDEKTILNNQLKLKIKELERQIVELTKRLSK